MPLDKEEKINVVYYFIKEGKLTLVTKEDVIETTNFKIKVAGTGDTQRVEAIKKIHKDNTFWKYVLLIPKVEEYELNVQIE